MQFDFTEARAKQALGQRIRSARIAAGYTTIASASEASGIAPTWLSDWENGRRLPTYAKLDELCRRLRLDPAALLTDSR